MKRIARRYWPIGYTLTIAAVVLADTIATGQWLIAWGAFMEVQATLTIRDAWWRRRQRELVDIASHAIWDAYRRGRHDARRQP